MEVAHGLTHILAADYNVEKSVILEVVDHQAASGEERIEAGCVGDVFETADILAGSERGGRNELRCRHAVWVFSQRKVCDIQEPLRLVIVGIGLQIFTEVIDSTL